MRQPAKLVQHRRSAVDRSGTPACCSGETVATAATATNVGALAHVATPGTLPWRILVSYTSVIALGDSALGGPQPDLPTAATAWIYTGGAHHTGFSFDLSAEHLADFAEMAGMEFLLIDNTTTVASFKKELRWNDLYYHLAKGL
jgi:hypothetical protein